MSKRIILSGIRPTAEDQHLGNYLGAIKDFVELSSNPGNDCFYFIADQHALTTTGVKFEAEGIRRGRSAIVLNLLAAGVNPESTIYAQSAIPETSELAWILGCLAKVHSLEEMHHWSEKKGQLQNLVMEANAGLLTYPVLMAADILGPRADLIPVGKDQYQHVEFARDLARAFNRVTGTTFFQIPNLSDRNEMIVRSLTKPEEKMSKSDADGCVFLNDPEKLVQRKFTRAVSDPARKLRTDPGDPLVCNVYTFHQQLSSGERLIWAQKGCLSASIGCFECKSDIGKTVFELLAPIQERRRELEASGGETYVRDVLEAGARKARKRITETVAEVKELMGLAKTVQV